MTVRNIRVAAWLCLVVPLLNGCAAPTAFQIISLAADGISYLATDKTITDHGVSAITQKDCKMVRLLKGDEVCLDEEKSAHALTDLPEELPELVAQ